MYWLQRSQWHHHKPHVSCPQHFSVCRKPRFSRHWTQTSASVVFQALVNYVLRDMLNHFVFVYLDDILIFSPDLQSHQHVRTFNVSSNIICMWKQKNVSSIHLRSPDPVSEQPSDILPRTCIVGAVFWEIEEQMKHASQTVNVASNCPQNRLFIVPTLHSSVIGLMPPLLHVIPVYPGISRLSSKDSGGRQLIKTSKNMCSHVRFVLGVKVRTKPHLVYCILFQFLIAPGHTFPWTLLLVFSPPNETLPYSPL